MAEVQITVNGRVYHMACDDGQEEHLLTLADYVGGRVAELAQNMGQVGDARLLVMASILIADELSDLRAEFDDFRQQMEARLSHAEDALADRLNSLAERLEAVASDLDAP